MKLTKSRLLDIIREEIVNEAGVTRADLASMTQEIADVWAPNAAGDVLALNTLKKHAGKLASKYGSAMASKIFRTMGLGIVADAAGNLTVAPIAKGMSKVRGVTGTEPIWPESWKDTIVDRLPEDPGAADIAGETAKAALGMERDIDFKRALNPLAYSADVVAAATGRVPGGGGTLTGPGWTQADADDYYAAQAEADELGDARDDGDTLQETLTRWQKIIKS